ncbi:MAG: GIY-YIG nuclease family protein [Dehalococcoidales bacterium]|nr:GIY-YIG nuclease family protein [Dehalococcoidales bacterium]
MTKKNSDALFVILSEANESVGGAEKRYMRDYYVYIMSNHSRTLYIGVTNNLPRRVSEHKAKLVDGFTKRYNLNRLVYYENTNYIATAIEREKEIKGWVRRKKVALIHSFNPAWEDLSLEFMESPPDCHSEGA